MTPYNDQGALTCALCGWVHYPGGRGPRHSYACVLNKEGDMRTIFDEGSVEILAQALEVLVGTERLLVVNNPEGGPTIDKDAVRQYAFALCGEVHELADELGWKDWKLPKVPDVGRVEDEFADVLAFLGVMAQLTTHIAGTDLGALADQFRAKSQVNIARINDGLVEGYIGQAKYKDARTCEPGQGSVYLEAIREGSK